MKIEEFAGKIKTLMQTFLSFLRKREAAAIQTGAQGRAGAIREATVGILTKAAKRVENILQNWDLEKMSTILGNYLQTKVAINELRSEDTQSLELLERAQKIWTSSKYGVPDNINRAVTAHRKLDSETEDLQHELQNIVDLEINVAELKGYPISAEPPILESILLEQRALLVTKYQEKLTLLSQRFQINSKDIEKSPTQKEIRNTWLQKTTDNKLPSL